MQHWYTGCHGRNAQWLFTFCIQPYSVLTGICSSSAAAFADPRFLANLTACTLYSSSYSLFFDIFVSSIFPFFYFIPLWLTCQVCYIGSKSTSLSTPIGVKVTCFLAFYAFETIPAFIKSCISCRFGITFNAPFLVVISDAPAFAKYSNSRSCSFVSLFTSCSNT